MRTIKVGRSLVKLTHEDTVFFPKDKISKGDVIDYYRRMAPFMLPFLKNRPLTMQRFPEGIAHEGFYHKDAPAYFPAWIKRVAVKRKDEQKTTHYVMCNQAATLVYLANYGVLTPHLWLSKIDDLRVPDRMLFDLDPSGVPFAAVRTGALILRDLLRAVHLEPFVMSTGSRGVHLVIPLKREHDFDTVRALAYDIARIAVVQHPELFTLEMRKEKRTGHVFLDILRNSFGATGVAPYALRARDGAPVAAPLFWDELSDARLSPTKYTLKNIQTRLARLKHDPWQAMARTKSSVARAWPLVGRLLKKHGISRESV